MHGVIRFLDHELLPASSPNDYPKIIRTGIDEEGQHPKSPEFSAIDGIMTLFHRLGQPATDFKLIERLLDVDGTPEFEFQMDMGNNFMASYVIRKGRRAEIGYVNEKGQRAQHGVRFEIKDVDTSLPYKFGAWSPTSTSDLGSGWGGSDIWVRAQSCAVARGIWFHQHWQGYSISILRWSGISPEDEVALDKWRKEFAKDSAKRRQEAHIAYEKCEAELGWEAHSRQQMDESMKLYSKLKARCRNDCGVEDAPLRCSKCLTTRYCSQECQKEDWKYHKSICGRE